MSLKNRVEKLELGPNRDGRCFHVEHLAEDLAEARRLHLERIRRGEKPIHIPYSERELPNPDDYTHPLDRALVDDMRGMILRRRRLEAEGLLDDEGYVRTEPKC